jgi:uncharacterized membrane protein
VESSAARSVEGVPFARIVAFTDGVFAIAITLLVLNFQVPDVPEARRGELGSYLGGLWGDVGAYFISFAVLGRLWLVHHRLFATLHRFDYRLMALNLGYLSLIVLVPFAAELLGDYGTETWPVVIYACVLGGAGILNWVMARHAVRGGLVHPDHREATRPWGGPQALFIPAVFLASIPVAFASPLAAELMWIGLLFARVAAARRGPLASRD